ncbi:BPSL0067 family protein [Oxalobacteraceae bacterium A2-2]
MEYRYIGNLAALENSNPVGDGECVRVAQHYAKAPLTSFWRPGERVLDAAKVWPGTAIATFAGPRARYKNAHGNHAALFISAGPRDADGKPRYIVVMDQWRGRNVKSRTIQRYTPARAKALNILDCDNAESFYIIR